MVTLTRLIVRHEWKAIETILSLIPIEQIEIDKKGGITEESVLHFALRYAAPRMSRRVQVRRPAHRVRVPGERERSRRRRPGPRRQGSDTLCRGVLREQLRIKIFPSGEGKHDPIHQHILRQAAPYSFNLEDADGCNAIEYAIANNADMKVIKVMQRTARDDWKTMKAAGHG